MLKQATVVSLLLLSLLAACDKKEPGAPPPQSTARPAPDSEYPLPADEPAKPQAAGVKVAQANDKGKKVYDATCVACHAAGVAGAPKLGDKALWAPRIAQGMDTLYMHALKGFTGKTGVMPPKGGAVNLPDADVKAGVDYMVAQAR